MHAMMFPIWNSGPILFETSQPCGSSEHGSPDVFKLAQTIITGIYGSTATIIGVVTIHQGRKAWKCGLSIVTISNSQLQVSMLKSTYAFTIDRMTASARPGTQAIRPR